MHLIAQSNADFEFGATYKYNDDTPVNLTGAVPWMQIRNKAGGDTVYYDSDGENHFTVNAVAGTIVLVIPVAVVGTWTFKRAEWDILLVYPSGPKPFMSGTIELDAGVTRAVTP